MKENLLLILRSLSCGCDVIIETPSGKYISPFAKQFNGGILVPEGSLFRDLESRLQFELYGEFPLSENNQQDWDDSIRDAFNFKKNKS